jgi:putative tryptophan/tyrosine transport system substrate-binding protein
VIGVIHSASPGGYAFYVTTFRNGLKEAGYIEGRNVAVECLRAEGSPCNIETAHLARRSVQGA